MKRTVSLLTIVTLLLLCACGSQDKQYDLLLNGQTPVNALGLYANKYSVLYLSDTYFLYTEAARDFVDVLGETMPVCGIYKYDLLKDSAQEIYVPDRGSVWEGVYPDVNGAAAVNSENELLYFVEYERLSAGFRFSCMQLELGAMHVTRVGFVDCGRNVSSVALSMTPEGSLLFAEQRTGRAEWLVTKVDVQTGDTQVLDHYTAYDLNQAGDASSRGAAHPFTPKAGTANYFAYQKTVLQEESDNYETFYFLVEYQGDMRIEKEIEMERYALSSDGESVGLLQQISVCDRYCYILGVPYAFLFTIDSMQAVTPPKEARVLMERANCQAPVDASEQYMLFTDGRGAADSVAHEAVLFDTEKNIFHILRFGLDKEQRLRILAYDSSLNAIIQIGTYSEISDSVEYRSYRINLEGRGEK
ncbi:hypothetical protein LJC32_01035 [Oscillospiraceae bacterium OttesenSCG-928-F05]|nr:hypothetical protein [Oscillospiraceae bacterium OttesenSCG-928-F05]